jgi:hypothetical protein
MWDKMLKYKFIFSILLAIVFTNCSICKKDTYLKLRECVKNKTDINFYDIYGTKNIDVYKMVDAIEKELISKGTLKKISKESYLELIDSVERKDFFLSKNKIIEEYSMISPIIIIDLVSTCNYEIMIKEKNKLNSSLVNQFRISQNLLATGYEFKDIREFIESTESIDFEHIEFRAPVMVMILFHIEKWNR